MISKNIALAKIQRDNLLPIKSLGSALLTSSRGAPSSNSCSQWSVCILAPNAGRKLLGDLFLEVSLSPVCVQILMPPPLGESAARFSDANATAKTHALNKVLCSTLQNTL
jgi:hypothetical protein